MKEVIEKINEMKNFFDREKCFDVEINIGEVKVYLDLFEYKGYYMILQFDYIFPLSGDYDKNN